NPQFFAGEPIDDISPGVQANRLIIRLQSSGKKRETTDSLIFDIVDSREVARCVRGRMVVLPTGEVRPDYDVETCSWATGVPRLAVSPDAFVRAYFSPRASCTEKVFDPTVVATANSDLRTQTSGNWDSWIELVAFGGAVQGTGSEGLSPT